MKNTLLQQKAYEQMNNLYPASTGPLNLKPHPDGVLCAQGFQDGINWLESQYESQTIAFAEWCADSSWVKIPGKNMWEKLSFRKTATTEQLYQLFLSESK